MQRPSFCNHIDYPCCGCGDDTVSPELYEEMQQEIETEGFYQDSFPDDDVEGVDYEEGCADEAPSEDDGMTDVEADADTLRCAGWGTDEDYHLGEMYDDHFDCEG